MNDRDRWNEKYRTGNHPDTPNVRLIMYQGRLARGKALDVAGGPGENAAILALAGWQTVLSEISDEACTRARERAIELKADLQIVQSDIHHLPFRTEFDTVVCAYFLERSVDLTSFLRPGGTLFFETFTTEDRKYKPQFPDQYRLQPGELKERFSDMEVLHYAEQDNGSRAFATLIARKR